MNPKSFPQRLADAAWASEWPAQPQFGEGKPLTQSSLPVAMGWAWQTALSVRAALDGTGEAVPLDLAHRFFDELELWTIRHRALLTWPPTPLSFARALSASARQNDPSVASVLMAYPDYCQQMLEQGRAIDPSIPSLDALFLAATPSAPAEIPRSVPSAPSPAPPPVPSASRSRGKISIPAEPPKFLLDWAASVAKEREPALAKQFLDQKVKSALSEFSGSPWKWFNEVLLPGMASLPVDDLHSLLGSWPHHNRFAPPNPVQFVDSSSFWVVMRDMGPERREVFSSGGLAVLLNMDEVTAHTRLEMATKMFPFVAKKPSAFRQRLQLWMSLGGGLDEKVVATEEGDLSASTAREWIAQQGNEEWDAVVEGLAPSAAASRFVRRGPG